MPRARRTALICRHRLGCNLAFLVVLSLRVGVGVTFAADMVKPLASTQPAHEQAAALVHRIAEDYAAPHGWGANQWTPGVNDPPDDRRQKQIEFDQGWVYLRDAWVGRVEKERIEQDADVKALIALGPAAAGAIERILPSLKLDSQAIERLIVVLGRVGTAQSMPVLLDLLRQVDKEPAQRRTDGAGSPPAHGAVLWALRELTGRPLIMTAKEWDQWWREVGPTFVVARDREARKVARESVEQLMSRLDKSDWLAAERLVALGPNAVPHLLALLQDATGQRKYWIAWCIDEIGAAAKMPPKVRLEYFMDRLAADDLLREHVKCARQRSLSEQTLADYCTLAIEADRRRAPNDPPVYLTMRHWVEDDIKPYFGKTEGVEPAAIKVLAAGLQDRDLVARTTAVTLAEKILGFAKTGREGLAAAVAGQWRVESEKLLHRQLTLVLAELPPADRKAAELAGADLKAVQQAALDLALKDDWRFRFRFVQALRQWPEVLQPHLPTLIKDPDELVRRQCALALGETQKPEYGPTLLGLMSDESDHVRSAAIRALADPAFRAVIPDLAPLLGTTEYSVRAEEAISKAGGPEAVAALIAGLPRAPGGVNNAIRQSLNRLTGQSLREPDAWLTWWWGHNPLFSVKRPPGKAKLSDDELWRLWRDLGAEQGAAPINAVIAMSDAGDQAVDFIAANLAVVPRDLATSTEQLIKDLDSPEYAVRERAATDLQDKASRVLPLLRPALKKVMDSKNASPEQKLRLELLLAKFDTPDKPYPTTDGARRAARAVWALERVGSPKTRELLTTYATGHPDDWATRHAVQALERMKKSPAPKSTAPSATEG